MKTYSRSECDPEILELVDAAERASEAAYCPHSRFSVGAVVKTVDDKVIAAANYESASYGLSQCAERGAIQQAQLEGCAEKITIIVVFAKAKGIFKAGDIVTPCGACRQWIVELANRSGRLIEIYCSDASKDKLLKLTSEELLPAGFDRVDT